MLDTDIPDSFRALQAQLRQRWREIEEFDLGDYDILVLPSHSIDQRELLKIPGNHHYEERLLFSLIRLWNPRTRLVYITSQPLHPIVVDYYLQLLPGIPFSHAHNRLLLLSTYDSSQKPLTQKILERPRLIERIRQALRPERSYIICYNATSLEQELSVQLGIPLLAASPELLYLGTKSGSRRVFEECKVPHPDGSPLVWTVEDLADEATELWERQPDLRRMVIKLNVGFSGEGNALLDLELIQKLKPTHKLSAESHGQRVAAMGEHFSSLRFQSAEETWTSFSSRIPEVGAIVEAFIEGEQKRSPSVQGQITPTGEVEILSTHDQILGGPDGQIFLGCSFPADAPYRLDLQELGLRIGENLAKKGVLERFGVDFIAVPQVDGSWDLQAIEINLRKGGTTHPFMTLKFLTHGHYNFANGLFYSQQGHAKYYIASDNLQKDQYRGLLPSDLMDIIAYHRLHFDSSTQTGTVFHLIGSLSEYGKVGLTSIGNSLEEAQAIYDRVVQVLDQETESHTGSRVWSLSPALPITWK
jgi:PGM1 C-terminal domain